MASVEYKNNNDNVKLINHKDFYYDDTYTHTPSYSHKWSCFFYFFKLSHLHDIMFPNEATPFTQPRLPLQ